MIRGIGGWRGVRIRGALLGGSSRGIRSGRSDEGRGREGK